MTLEWLILYLMLSISIGLELPSAIFYIRNLRKKPNIEKSTLEKHIHQISKEIADAAIK